MRELHRSLGLVAALAALGSCQPTPPPGSYLCSPEDLACPGSQHCTCGLCVDRDSQAACSLEVTAAVDAATPPSEHQSFGLTITALGPTGIPSTFSGTVQLSAQQGDVRPTSVQLDGGSVVILASLNREADPGDVITARFAGVQGFSAPIPVIAPPLLADDVPTLNADAPFGAGSWASQVRYASVYIGQTGAFEAVFVGSNASDLAAVGHAVSQDAGGGPFVADGSPAWGPTGAGGFPPDVQQPSVYYADDGGQMLAYSRVNSQGLDLAVIEQGHYVALPCDGGSCVVQCAFCSQPGFDPDVIVVPGELDASCHGAPSWRMYFQAVKRVDGTNIPAVGVATSCDGVNFTPFPNPVLVGGDLFSQVIFAPHVLLDGHVFKMWFTFSTDAIDTAVFQNFCASSTNAGIGYATSSDGLLWVPSHSNPVLPPSAAPWWGLGATARTLRVTSVLPTDGLDPNNGISVYYTPDLGSPADAGVCAPGGLGRAVRG
jgi:hypothetical protein